MTTIENEAPSSVASSTIPIIRAMPTGSLNPDSPSRIVPERPRTSLPARTEKVTAGSVGASAAPINPDTIQERSSATWAATAISAAVPNVPRTPSARDGHGGAPEPAQPDLRAAFEQDHDERQRRDPLHVLEREDRREPVDGIRRHRRDDEEDAGRRDREAPGEHADGDREREPGRHDEHELPELEDVVHAGDLAQPRWRMRRNASSDVVDL